MDKVSSECPYPGCFFCVMKEGNPNKRKASILKFFRDLPSQDDDGQVLPISGLWNTAMAHPNDPEFVELGIFECMAALIWKGLKNHRWLSHDQNIYIPYYAAHIIGSYTMNMEEFAEIAVHAGVIPPLVELLRGRLTWVEQRVAVRALGHLATYASTFNAVASHGEILELSIQLAMSSLEIVYSHFYQYVDRRLSYHCDLLTRGMGGVEMESRKAEEWASQLQCWSLQLINCFAFKSEFLPTICKPEFLTKLPGMWGGLVNEASPAGIGLLRTICHHKLGRGPVAGCAGTIESLCNIARSSDDWQYMAIDCLLWLIQDPNTCHKVIDKAVAALVDLADVTTLGDHKKLGDTIVSVLQECVQSQGTGRNFPSNRTKELIEELLNFRKRLKWEKSMPKEDLRIKQAAALVVKLEGNSLFSSGNIAGSASKYSEALALCPVRSKKERVVLYSNRAQCHLLLQQPLVAISDATRALCLHNPPNRHAKSLWRRAQAYDMLGLAKESLLDAILFINECSQSSDPDLSLRQNKVPDSTASEHLKRGTCPNFNSVAKPISLISPSANIGSQSSPTTVHHNHRKRSSSGGESGSSYHVSPLTIVNPSRFRELSYSTSVSTTPTAVPLLPQQPHLMLSGGKEDLGALAMLEDSVKKLKSPKTSPGPALSKAQIDCALDFLVDWVYESSGSVSFSSLEHPKFRAFLNQVGFPAISPREFMGSRLDTKFEEAKAESEARIGDAMFFQIASDGWKSKNYGVYGEDYLVNLTVNLPNGTSVYRRAVFVSESVPSKYAEEVLWETVTGICGNVVQQCVGIVADRFKDKALRNLENRNQWMVNLSCQFQGFNSLLKDFNGRLPLCKTVTENCLKLADFVNNKSQVRHSFHKYQLQEYGFVSSLRLPLREYDNLHSGNIYTLFEDILNSSRALRLVLLDDSYKLESMDDPIAREVGDMIRDAGFWNELEAVHSLIKLIKDMAQDIEKQRPLVGQCLPLWDELRANVKDWCSKFHISEEAVEKVIERRFKKNYHSAWPAAFILDPLYLIRDTSGKYLPPFKCLTTEQEKDVEKLITRLVSREEAHVALMELMKWRTEGLDPVYARAVQMKERDPITGKMRIVNPQSSRLVWETHLTEFKSLGKVAVRLIFLHATSCGFKCNFSLLRWVSLAHGHSMVGLERAQKLVFIAAQSKLDRRDFSSDEDKDAELLALANGEDYVLNEVLVDTSSV